MKEILIAILIPQLFILTILLIIRSSKKDEAVKTTDEEDGGRVFEILHQVFLDMNRQHMAAVGPWISSAIEHRCGDPSIALTAIRFTLRDVQNLPIGDGVTYVEGVRFRFNLDALKNAEKELMGMCA